MTDEKRPIRLVVNMGEYIIPMADAARLGAQLEAPRDGSDTTDY